SRSLRWRSSLSLLDADERDEQVISPESLDVLSLEADFGKQPDEVGFAARLHQVAQRLLLVEDFLVAEMPPLVMQIERGQHVLGLGHLGESLLGDDESSAGNQALIDSLAHAASMPLRQELQGEDAGHQRQIGEAGEIPNVLQQEADVRGG